MTDIKHELSDLINFTSTQKPIEFEQAFQSLITDKLSDAIGFRKMDIAQSMFAESEEIESEE